MIVAPPPVDHPCMPACVRRLSRRRRGYWMFSDHAPRRYRASDGVRRAPSRLLPPGGVYPAQLSDPREVSLSFGSDQSLQSKPKAWQGLPIEPSPTPLSGCRTECFRANSRTPRGVAAPGFGHSLERVPELLQGSLVCRIIKDGPTAPFRELGDVCLELFLDERVERRIPDYELANLVMCPVNESLELIFLLGLFFFEPGLLLQQAGEFVLYDATPGNR